jgi:diguanylate cyclase (GGDEF)-like protein
LPTDHTLARLGIVLALLTLLGLGLLSLRSSVEQERSATWVAHTHEVIQALEQITAGVAAAESQLRGFAISRQPQFLEDISTSLARAERGVSEVERLTIDTRAQRQAVRTLRPLLARRASLLRERRKALEAGAPAAVPMEAIQLTDSIQRIVHEAVATERRLLRERRKIAEQRAQRARTTLGAGLLASVLLVLGAFWLVDREMRRRKTAEEERVKELSLLLELGEFLQACATPAEAYDVIKGLAPRFFPGIGGAVSELRPSSNLAEVKLTWGHEALQSASAFEPADCWGLRRGQSHASEHEAGLRCKHLPALPHLKARCNPLLANGELLGALHLSSMDTLPQQLAERAAVFGEQVALALANLRLRETLRNQSIRDPLTGLFNRRYTEETLSRELSRAARDKTPLSLLMLDVDHFKRFNDTFGHEIGDEVLKQIAVLLQRQTRGSDVASRLGGEELLVLLPGAALEAARSKAETIREAVSHLAIRAQGKAIGPVTISIGVATYPEHGQDGEELMRSADTALYAAKRGGRDRVEVAE